ncbi:DUF6479 family protein [Streptomyces sp. NPDC058398]|uniref:DUF6479 family protein n=1 Tax=Streptomyces sp. NPDC058398 TaxID=3346479 RepID=UPI003646F74C
MCQYGVHGAHDRRSADHVGRSSAGALWLTAAGVAVVAVLIAAFVVGGRRAARRKVSTPGPGAEQARRVLADPAQRGEGWSTPDDDPEQGRPRR